MKIIYTLILVVCLVISCSKENKIDSLSSKNQNKKPNIVYILADDLGYGDIKALNPKSGITTPNMDSLVSNGIHFTNAHSNSSVCTPTRYGILTGRYAWRSRLKKEVLWGYDSLLIEKDRPTIATFLGNNGYETACIGKWHLGLDWVAKDSTKPIASYTWRETFKKGDDSNVDFSKKAGSPNDVGFDYSYIIPSSLDMTPYVYLENGKVTELPTDFTEGKDQKTHGRGVFWRSGEKSPSFDFYDVLDNFTSKATNYIEKQKNTEKPFFLYFPITAPHTPWLPTELTKGKSETGRYGDFVMDVDRVVGHVVASLKKSGQYENTLIILTSDNGSHWKPEDKEKYTHRANHIFKGQKADIYEAGHHIPFVAVYPQVIQKNTKSNKLLCTTDLLATVADLIDTEVPNGTAEDSENIWPAFIGKDSLSERTEVIHHSLHGVFSVTKGDWKLTNHLGSGGFSDPATIQPKDGEEKGTLYNIKEDPSEKNNLYLQKPEIVAELTAIIEKAQRESLE